MTKLKNTKKGMAKKALSISLVAAMLATSNVPVWAAEDLFSDGSAAVQAEVVEEVDMFTAEETPAEDVAPAVEETETVIAETRATSMNNNYTVSPTISGVTNNSFIWNKASDVKATFTVNSKDNADIPANIKFFYAWKINGLASKEETITAKTSIETESPSLSATDAGKTLTLYVYAKDTNDGNKVVWDYTSDAINIAAIDYSAEMQSIDFDSSWAPKYDGKAHRAEKKDINFGTLSSADFDIAVSGELTDVTDDGVTVTITSNKPGYTGTKVLNYKIAPLTLDGTNALISDHMVATLKTTNYTYTGNVIRVKAADVTLIDKDTDVDLSNYLQADEHGYVSLGKSSVQGIGEHTIRLNLISGTPETGNKNYNIAQISGTPSANDADGYRTVGTTNKATVKARDLSTVNVSIKAQAIPAPGKDINFTVDNVTFTDATTKEKLNLLGEVDINVPEEATSKGTYTVTITPKKSVENVSGKATATLKLVGADISEATFTGTEATTAEPYTGEEITKTEKQLGSLTLEGKTIDKSEYDVVYENNINAGTAKIIVKGKNSFEGSEAEFNFTITPAVVTADDITFKNKVEYKDTKTPADYKEAMDIVVKAKNSKGKVFTLTEGTDYTVKYTFNANGNVVDTGAVVAEIKVTNKNFTPQTAFTKTATIKSRAIKSENIKLKETSFTYTGKSIKPEFDVVIDGRVVNPALYTVNYTNNINAGTATLTVKGTDTTDKDSGDVKYSDVEAKIDFTIAPADVTKLDGVIASKEYKGYSLELAEEDFNLTLGGDRVNIKNNFNLTYGENIEIGDGSVTLTPKNNNFTGSRTFTFQITGKMLSDGGSFTFYQNGIKVTDKDSVFKYDGLAHAFDQTTFAYANSSVKLTEGKDYEIKYIDNIYGKKMNTDSLKGQYGAVLAIAKGEYGSNNNKGTGLENGVYTDAAGNKIANVISVQYFKIEQQPVAKSNISVSNATYAGGLQVKPVVKVIVNGVTLEEGKDYKLDFGASDSKRINVTDSKSLEVTVEPINGYMVGNETLAFKWGIDKFDLANADVTVDGDKITVKCGRIDIETSEYTVEKKDGTVTITANKDSKNYTGTKSINAETEDQKPVAPVISDVNVAGNKATVILAGESEGATGYDYVISKSRVFTDKESRVGVNANVLSTKTSFSYVGQGTYYAYLHSWKRVDGKKVFSDWSNAYPFVVSSITPEQPVVTNVTRSGSTVKVTYTQSANATGYDIVLGKEVKKVNGEMRPVNYGNLVSKIKKGTTVTATFKNVPKGTYYAGLHAFNRTSENGTKVFSKWSNTKKVIVK